MRKVLERPLSELSLGAPSMLKQNKHRFGAIPIVFLLLVSVFVFIQLPKIETPAHAANPSITHSSACATSSASCTPSALSVTAGDYIFVYEDFGDFNSPCQDISAPTDTASNPYRLIPNSCAGNGASTYYSQWYEGYAQTTTSVTITCNWGRSGNIPSCYVFDVANPGGVITFAKGGTGTAVAVTSFTPVAGSLLIAPVRIEANCAAITPGAGFSALSPTSSCFSSYGSSGQTEAGATATPTTAPLTLPVSSNWVENVLEVYPVGSVVPSLIQNPQHLTSGLTSTSAVTSSVPVFTGELLTASCVSSNAMTTYLFTDSQGNSWTTDQQQSISTLEAAAIGHTIATATGSDTVTCTASAAQSGGIAIILDDVQWQYGAPIVGGSQSSCTSGCTTSTSVPSTSFGTTNFIEGTSVTLPSGVDWSTSGGFTLQGIEFSGICATVQTECGIYSANTVASPSTFPFLMSGCSSCTWVEVAATYSATGSIPGTATCSILNPDAGNYLLPNGKYYDFHCVVDTLAIGNAAPIIGVRITFNDSLHIMTASYSNNTAVSYGVGFSMITNNASTAILSPSSKAVGSFNPSTGDRTFTIDYLIAFNAATLVDSVNRGIYIFAFTDLLHTLGPKYLGNSFNFLNKGGGVNILSAGKCGVYPGSDTFQDYCYYGGTSHNWIAENATYYNLQQYQSQFFMETDNQSSAGPTFTINSPQMGYYWQPYSESGPGTNPSSNKGDAQLRMGLYYYDNTTWVKGLNVLIEMGDGRVGSSNLWTHLDILWYNGKSTLLSNQSIYAFVPQINLSQVGIWVNLWYSQNNMSTTQGGMVGSYYTGMHKTGFLIFTSWSPFLQNQTESQVFAPLLDHTGHVMSTQQAQFTKVYENLTRPGAPLVNAKQFNFQIQTTNFKEQEFNTASAGMGGIVTPTFAGAIVPVISSPSVFSPIINAIKAIATYISKALQALGQVIWLALQRQFPWFTNFWTFVGQAIFDFINILGQVSIGLIQVLTFIVNNISQFILVPFNIIGQTWANTLVLLSAFTKYLPAADIPILIELYIIITLGLSVFEALATGDWPYIIRLTRQVWGIANTIFYWTWALAKILIDTIEGLIP